MQQEKIIEITTALRIGKFKILLLTEDGKHKELTYNGYNSIIEEKPIIYLAEK